jgi:thioredoxin 1
MKSVSQIFRRNNHFISLLLVATSLLSFSEAFITRFSHERQTRISPLGVAKSGGKLIKSADMYQDSVVAENRPVLVFFSAPWCGPCRLTNPVVKDILKQFSGQLDVVEVCTDDLAEIAEEAGVVSIPTIQFYYKGEQMETIVGCVAKSVLASAVSKVLEDVSRIKSPSP